jgi:prephenate dehydrogenase
MSGRSILVSSLGLMGGSLAAALSAQGWRVWLHHRRPEVARAAAAKGWGTAVAEPAEARDAELAVVCTPVSAIPAAVRAIAAETRAVITDVGSSKAWLCRELADLAPRFVGSHPMAGSHRAGFEHADPELYRDRVCIVTPAAASPPAAVALVEELWQAAGSRVVRLDPDAHDRAVAEASHVPHVLACAAAAQLGERAAPLAAGGFRDVSRIAASSPAMWADILLTNAAAISEGLARTTARLESLRSALARGDRATVEAWLADGRQGRERYDRAQGDA